MERLVAEHGSGFYYGQAAMLRSWRRIDSASSRSFSARVEVDLAL
jgi:hypothetical protein